MMRYEMLNTIKTLLELNIPIRQIARELKIDRNTVKSVKRKISNGMQIPLEINRKSILDDYEDKVKELLEKNYTAKQIYNKLIKEKGIGLSYSSVACITDFRTP